MRASQYLLNVKCPYCANGVSEQKCLSTNSVMKCGTCKKTFWAFVCNGFVTTATMESANCIFPSTQRMLTYYQELGNVLEIVKEN